MNRLFGRGKPKEPPPSITDCIAGVRQTNPSNLSLGDKNFFQFFFYRVTNDVLKKINS